MGGQKREWRIEGEGLEGGSQEVWRSVPVTLHPGWVTISANNFVFSSEHIKSSFKNEFVRKWKRNLTHVRKSATARVSEGSVQTTNLLLRAGDEALKTHAGSIAALHPLRYGFEAPSFTCICDAVGELGRTNSTHRAHTLLLWFFSRRVSFCNLTQYVSCGRAYGWLPGTVANYSGNYS